MNRVGGRTHRGLWLAGVAMLAVTVALPTAAFAGQSAEGDDESLVDFEGEAIDLTVGWGDAEACLIWSDAGVAECFRDEAAMDAKIAEVEKQLELGGVVQTTASQCSGYLRLYDGSYHSGQVLYMRDRQQWINLSAFGFSNRTSSFTIGACSSYLADYDWGGGSWYATSATEAWDVAYTMASGWNNRVSSVYIR